MNIYIYEYIYMYVYIYVYIYHIASPVSHRFARADVVNEKHRRHSRTADETDGTSLTHTISYRACESPAAAAAALQPAVRPLPLAPQ